MSVIIENVIDYFDRVMPRCLAESWDNTGLLLGEQAAHVGSVMTCLTITPSVVDEAIRRSASLIVSHHPLPFRPVGTITDSTYYGGMIWRLASAGVNVFSPHTRYDSASEGINQQLAEMLKLQSILPLVAFEDAAAEESRQAVAPRTQGLGRGRLGVCSQGTTLKDLLERLKVGLSMDHLKLIPAGNVIGIESIVQKAAVGCGSAGDFVRDAARVLCDLFITGEATFHGCLEAQSLGVAMVLTGHYASERFAVETLAERLSIEFPSVDVWASHAEKSPVKFV